MDVKILQQPIVEGGIRSINFFNGRLLTGQDLSREQVARREADRRVAQAAGDGVAYGLEVSASSSGAQAGPVVTIQPGLAVSRNGRTLFLKEPTDIVLGRRALPRIAATRTFDDCAGLKNGTYAAHPGIYLLTIAPAEDREGKALTHALDDAVIPCNTDTVVEAVQLRLLPLEPDLDAATLADSALLRNRIAYKCFGAEGLLSYRTDPFATAGEPYGLLTGIDGKTLTDCDVPLAVVSLQVDIDFIDMWSVRRRVTRRSPAGPWTMLAGDRRQAEGEAMFLQFQDQLDDIMQAQTPSQPMVAAERVEHLPAAGLIPLPGDAKVAEAALGAFFTGLTTRGPIFIEGARLEPLLRTSFAYPPISLKGPEKRHFIWLYRVRENLMTPPASEANGNAQAYVVFASGHIPYAGEARFDLGHFDYGNYALG